MINYNKQTTPLPNEMEKFGIQVQSFIVIKHDLVKSLKEMPGFIGVCPDGMVTALIFDTENDAKRCRNILKAKNVQVSPVSSVYVNKQYLSDIEEKNLEDEIKKAKEERYADFESVENTYKNEIQSLNQKLAEALSETDHYKSMYSKLKESYDSEVKKALMKNVELSKEINKLEHRIEELTQKIQKILMKGNK